MNIYIVVLFFSSTLLLFFYLTPFLLFSLFPLLLFAISLCSMVCSLFFHHLLFNYTACCSFFCFYTIFFFLHTTYFCHLQVVFLLYNSFCFPLVYFFGHLPSIFYILFVSLSLFFSPPPLPPSPPCPLLLPAPFSPLPPSPPCPLLPPAPFNPLVSLILSVDFILFLLRHRWQYWCLLSDLNEKTAFF